MLKDASIVQKWLIESRQEGQKEGELAVLQCLFDKKLGPPLPTVLLQMLHLNEEQLDRLTLAFFDINSQAELQAWLANGVDDSAKN